MEKETERDGENNKQNDLGFLGFGFCDLWFNIDGVRG
jgi:hypothetical protein